MSALQTIEPGPVVSHLQTDTFCTQCGYNLMTQAVYKDARLEILIARCPECGKFSAAGEGTTAGRIWLNRFATMILGSWVLLVTVVLFSSTAAMGMAAYGHLMEFTETALTPTSNPAVSSAIYTVRSTHLQDANEVNAMRWQVVAMTLLAVGLGVFGGGFFAVILWHSRGWRSRLAFFMPLAGCVITAIVWASDPMAASLLRWGIYQITLYLALEELGVMGGLIAGRPIARFFLRLVLPPKARQHFAFMWSIDGKQLKLD